MGVLSPDDAVKLANAGQELLRRDVLSGAIVILLGMVGCLAVWVVWLQQKLFSVAVHIDRNTDAIEMLLAEVQTRANRRRRTDVPQLVAEPASKVGPVS